MRSLLALGLIAAVMYVCGLDDNKRTESPTNTAAPAKAKPDKAAVLAELMVIEKEISEAAINGDISLLANAVTDDFELTGVDGKVQNKNEMLADIKKEKNVKSFTITDAELMSFSDDSAVLKYTQNIVLKTGQKGRAKVTDTFVKRDGRWLVRSEQQTLMR